MVFRIVIVAAAAILAIMPARAATSVYGASVFSETGAVTDSGFATGVSDGSGAFLGLGGDLVLSFDLALTGTGVTFNMLPVTGFNGLAVSIGNVVGGVATFSSEFVLFDTGSGPSLALDLSAACSGISAAGCNLVRIRNAGTFMGSTGALLDSISGVTAAPEPSVWALMILGFAGVGWRVKTARKTIFDHLKKRPKITYGKGVLRPSMST